MSEAQVVEEGWRPNDVLARGSEPLSGSGSNLVAEVLRGNGEIPEWEH
jgi:hypothetical protein